MNRTKGIITFFFFLIIIYINFSLYSKRMKRIREKNQLFLASGYDYSRLNNSIS